jgi:hypothetical protein
MSKRSAIPFPPGFNPLEFDGNSADEAVVAVGFGFVHVVESEL